MLSAFPVGLLAIIVGEPFRSVVYLIVGAWFVASGGLFLTNWHGARDQALDEQDYWMGRVSRWRRTSRRARSWNFIVGSAFAIPLGALCFGLGVIGLVGYLLGPGR